MGFESGPLRPQGRMEGIEKEVWRGIEIEGDRDFIDATRLALDKINGTESFEEVRDYLGRIKQAERSGMDVESDKPTFEVGPTSQESTSWYGSTIVHDAMHSKLYSERKDYLGGSEPSDSDWRTGKDAERACLRIQRKCLEEIGGTNDDIDAIDTHIDNPTYQGDGLHEDYLNRDW